jgi:hypothetical protein
MRFIAEGNNPFTLGDRTSFKFYQKGFAECKIYEKV